MKAMISEAYRPIVDLGLGYNDWKLYNFRLIDGEILFLDLESVYVLTCSHERALYLGTCAFMQWWKRFQVQRRTYGSDDEVE